MRPDAAPAFPAPNGQAVSARASTGAVCYLTGVGLAGWLVRAPAVLDRIGAGTLGAALVAAAAGAAVAAPAAGWFAGRLGSRPATRATALAFAAALALPPFAQTVPQLAVAVVLLGMATGALAASVHAQGAAVARRYGRPMMRGVYAMLGVGAVAGSAAGALAAHRGVGAAAHLAAAALLVGVGMCGVASGMLPGAEDAAPARRDAVRPAA